MLLLSPPNTVRVSRINGKCSLSQEYLPANAFGQSIAADLTAARLKLMGQVVIGFEVVWQVNADKT
jgi:hypothetical protein